MGSHLSSKPLAGEEDGGGEVAKLAQSKCMGLKQPDRAIIRGS